MEAKGGKGMCKRIVSMILSIVLVVGDLNLVNVNAAGDEQSVEADTVRLNESDYGDMEWKTIDGVLYVPEGIKAILNGVVSAEKYESEIARMQKKGISENEIDFNKGDVKVRKIILPSTVEYIGDNAYNNWKYLEEISIPGNVKEIGEDVFFNCENLKKVIIEDGVEKIGSGMFRGCENIETVVMPKTVKDWDTTCAFCMCRKLKNVTLPEEGMDTMGTGMFYGCYILEELTIPDCVTTMNYGVTLACHGLKILRAGENVVNFEEGENHSYDLLNFTDNILGNIHMENSNIVLEAPRDSKIVEYVRKNYGVRLKYDYPDCERMEYICDGKMVRYRDEEDTYIIEIKRKSYPAETMIYPNRAEGLKPDFATDRTDGMQLWYGAIDGIGDWSGSNYETNATYVYIDEGGLFPKKIESQYFLWKYYTQDENLEYTVENEEYFKITLTEQSLEEKKVQIEILTAGAWDGEDAHWELITPAIDTSVLTLTPIITKTLTPTPTVTPTPAKKTVTPAKVKLKTPKQLTTKKQGRKIYKKAVKLSWKKVENVGGYVIYMKLGKEKYKAVKTITNEKIVSYTKKNLKKGKIYYFKVRAYRKVNGQKIYGNYSGVKKVKIK